MIEKVLETIKKYDLIEDGERVIAGVSGGPDSICLLHILYTIAARMNLKIYAVHINHMLRGVESDADEAYVNEFCKSLGITVFSVALDIKKIAAKKGVSLEEAGREARYEQFKVHAGKVMASKIAVAHNKNDQCETVLMHIIRGAGLDGLKGMEYKRGQIIRPLLDIERSEIEKYCALNSLTPRIDSSNYKSIYTRNKIRLDLIPYINRLFETNFSNSLSRLSATVRDDVDYFEGIVGKLYEKCMIQSEKDQVELNAALLKSCHASLVRRIIRRAVKTVKGDLKGLESKHIESAIELLQSGKTGSIICLTNNIRVEKSYNVLKIYILENKKSVQYFETLLNIPGINFIENTKSHIEAELLEKTEEYKKNAGISYDSFVQFFDYEKLKTGIYIRYRKEGDMFKPLKSNGTKKLKEYFIDNKIPRELRGSIPLIARGSEIVWVIGYKISDKFKVTENTKYILRLKYNDEK